MLFSCIFEQVEKGRSCIVDQVEKGRSVLGILPKNEKAAPSDIPSNDEKLPTPFLERAIVSFRDCQLNFDWKKQQENASECDHRTDSSSVTSAGDSSENEIFTTEVIEDYELVLSESSSDSMRKQMRAFFPHEHPFTLHRFLVAAEMKVERACAMLQAHIEWRQSNLPIEINTIPNETKNGSCIFQGFSRDGFPVIYFRTRFQTPSNRDVKECIRLIVYTVERALGVLGDKRDSEAGKVVVVLDRIGETRENVDFDLGRELSSVMQRNYPERLHMVLVYPTDLLYICIWEVLKIFVDATNRERMKLLHSQEQLQEYINKSELLTELGGDAEVDLRL